MSAACCRAGAFDKALALVPGRRSGSKSPGGCAMGDARVNDSRDGLFLAATAGEFKIQREVIRGKKS